MKALTLWGPWDFLIFVKKADGDPLKKYETRSWMPPENLVGQRIAILADVDVKHARSISHGDIVQAARDAAYRGLADGLIVTGKATGDPIDPEDVRRVCEAVPDRRVFVGSGAVPETVESLLRLASGVIVGSGIKINGEPARPIDAELARRFAHAAGRS